MVTADGQLLLPLGWGPAMADDSLSAAVAAVTGAWIDDGVCWRHRPSTSSGC